MQVPRVYVTDLQSGYEGSGERPWLAMLCTCCHIASGEISTATCLHWEKIAGSLYLVSPGLCPMHLLSLLTLICILLL